MKNAFHIFLRVVALLTFLGFLIWITDFFKRKRPMPSPPEKVIAMCDVCHGYGVGCEVCRGRGVVMVDAPTGHELTAEPAWDVTCACGVKGKIRLPYEPLSLTEFVIGHHRGTHLPAGLTLACKCGSSIKGGPRIDNAEEFSQWLQTHSGCYEIAREVSAG